MTKHSDDNYDEIHLLQDGVIQLVDTCSDDGYIGIGILLPDGSKSYLFVYTSKTISKGSKRVKGEWELQDWS